MDWDRSANRSGSSGEVVSIPQSEFDGLGRTPPLLSWSGTFGFNSPVGIRWIGTCIRLPGFPKKAAVSIPQSEFDGLGRGFYAHLVDVVFRFNSPVGIRWIGTDGLRRTGDGVSLCFNSPVGIRWIGTRRPGIPSFLSPWFQFPSRNSMDWDGQSPDCGTDAVRCFNSPVGIRWIGTSLLPG